MMPTANGGVGVPGVVNGWMFIQTLSIGGPGSPPATPSIYRPDLGSIYSFVKSTGVYVCPDDSSKQGNSYSMSNIIPGVALSQINQPAATILFNEEADGYQGGTDDAAFIVNLAWNNPTIRHNNGSVAAFVTVMSNGSHEVKLTQTIIQRAILVMNCKKHSCRQGRGDFLCPVSIFGSGKAKSMVSFRQLALSLALLGAALPMRADNSSPTSAATPSLTKIHAQFAAKDATIADLQRQVAQQAAQIAALQKQASPAATPAPLLAAPAMVAEKPVQLSITAAATPVATLLGLLSRQAGIPLLADDTVQGTLGTLSVNQPGLEPALNQLKAVIPGLEWQKVYVPKDAPLPKGDVLSRQVRDLKALTVATLAVTDPATKSLRSLSQKKEDAAASVPEGMQTVYLITNEMVRARRQAVQNVSVMVQAPAPPMPQPAPALAGGGTVAQAVSGLQGASDMLGQMTPDEQRQALPLMFQQFGQMMQKIDPTVRRELFQQWQQQFHP